MRCPSCGAANRVEATTCEYCGSPLPAPETRDRQATFARIKSSPQYAHRNSPERHARLPTIHPFQKVFLSCFFVAFIGGTLFIFVMALGMSGIFGFVGFDVGGGPGGAMALIPLCMAVVPLGMAAVGVFLFLHTRKRMQAVETGPVQAIPVIVASKRTHVTGGGETSTRTHYHVTCETEDGERREYQVWDGNLYGRMAEEDAGVLYLRGDVAVDFDRVPA